MAIIERSIPEVEQLTLESERSMNAVIVFKVA